MGSAMESAWLKAKHIATAPKMSRVLEAEIQLPTASSQRQAAWVLQGVCWSIWGEGVSESLHLSLANKASVPTGRYPPQPHCCFVPEASEMPCYWKSGSPQGLLGLPERRHLVRLKFSMLWSLPQSTNQCSLCRLLCVCH